MELLLCEVPDVTLRLLWLGFWLFAILLTWLVIDIEVLVNVVAIPFALELLKLFVGWLRVEPL